MSERPNRMEFEELRRNWHRFGAEDPLWAILTGPDKRGGGWDPGEFFATGRVEVERVLKRVRAVEPTLTGRWRLRRRWRTGRALDFGCGVGRVSLALAEHFAEVDGVDIAPSMIELARHYDAHGRCAFHLTGEDLGLFRDGSFDFVYTAHVLQHMEPRYASRYVAEFLRVLRPGGLAFVELTTQPVAGASAPLPDAAFRAEILRLSLPRRFAAGQPGGPVLCRVTNRSPHSWPAAGIEGWFQVALGNHWLRPDGELVTLDDGRAPLPHDVAPSSATLVELTVTSPAAPGSYRLVIDLVQEGVAWFADKGSVALEVPVEVAPASTPPADDSAAAARRPRMEMYGTAEPQVLEWVAREGGQVVAVIDWDEISGVRASDWQRRGFILRPPPDRSGPPATLRAIR